MSNTQVRDDKTTRGVCLCQYRHTRFWQACSIAASKSLALMLLVVVSFGNRNTQPRAATLSRLFHAFAAPLLREHSVCQLAALT